MTSARRATHLVAAMTVALVLAVQGCAGGISTEEYGDALNRVCAKLRRETSKLSARPPGSEPALDRRLDGVRDATERALAQMKAIERPEGDDGAAAAEYVQRTDRLYHDKIFPGMQRLEDALDHGPKALKRAQKGLMAADDAIANDLARELGADRCL
jgi:uncharacterized protein YukE